MRVVVTGASGFVGPRLLARLRAEGFEAEGFDRDLDVTDPGALRACIAYHRPQAVVHLAAISFVPEAERDPARTWRVNFLGSLHLLEAVRREVPRARVLLVGTGQVYGSAAPGAPAFGEDQPLRPGNAYTRSKAAADLLGGGYGRRHGLAVVRARPFNHTGPGRPDHFVESSFARQLVEMELGRRPPVLAVGSLDAVRDFLDVADVVEAYVRLLAPDVAPRAYNVGSGVGIPIRELLARLIALSGVDPEIRADPARVRPPDVAVGASRRLAEATGWQPAHDLDATLAALLEHWREQLAVPAG